MKKIISIVLLISCSAKIASMETDRWEAQEYEKHSKPLFDVTKQLFQQDFGTEDMNGKRIVSLGSGTAFLEGQIAEANPKSTVICVDPSHKMTEFARQKGTKLNNMEFVEQGAQEYSRNGDTDAIFAYASFHYIDGKHHQAVFNNVRQSLKPGGRFSLVTAKENQKSLPLQKSLHRLAVIETCFKKRWKPDINKALTEKINAEQDEQTCNALQEILDCESEQPSNELKAALGKALTSGIENTVTEEKIQELCKNANLEIEKLEEKESNLDLVFENKDAFTSWMTCILTAYGLRRVFGENLKKYVSDALDHYTVNYKKNTDESHRYPSPAIHLVARKPAQQ